MRALSRLLIVAAVAFVIVLFFWFDLNRTLSFEHLKSARGELLKYYTDHTAFVVGAYALIYVLVTAASLPGALVLTLAGGALFGFWQGSAIVSICSTTGATGAFLVARFLLREDINRRYSDRLTTINRGIERDGGIYLFSLRLVPIFPFFLVNLLMGLTPIRTATFFWVSQLGMLPGTLVFVNAGTELSQLDSISGILSPRLLLAFALLALVPLLAKAFLGGLKMRRAFRGYTRPKHYDYNLVVIGAGAGGLVTAYIAAAVKARVALIERSKMGGDCLNTGCVPSKALIRSSKILAYIQRSKEFGIKSARAEFDFADVMARVKRVIRSIEPHDSVERYTQLGVEVLTAEARILSPFEVEVRTGADKKTITTRSIVVATGAEPFVPPIPGLLDTNYLTSDTIWELKALPKRLLVLGGGPIGCELAQCFARLGSDVSVVEMADRLLPREDPQVSQLLQAQFEREGIHVFTGYRASSFSTQPKNQATCERTDGSSSENLVFDHVLVASGRRARTTGFGLEELGIALTKRGTIEANELLRTNIPNIYVAGDVAGPYQFTHTAAHQAWYAAVNALFSPFKTFSVDYRVIPWVTYTDPEVAHVGLSQTAAEAEGIEFEVTHYGIDDLDRAIADEEAQGLVQVLTKKGSDKILGATIVGSHAGELLAEFVLAMKHNLGLKKILATIHPYPTLTEANKFAAGEWARAHAPAKLLKWVERFHSWRRSG